MSVRTTKYADVCMCVVFDNIIRPHWYFFLCIFQNSSVGIMSGYRQHLNLVKNIIETVCDEQYRILVFAHLCNKKCIKNLTKKKSKQAGLVLI